MKYRIVTNGKKFRIQQWCWYFPFWITSTYFYGLSDAYYEYETKEHAQMQIDVMNFNPDNEWKPL